MKRFVIAFLVCASFLIGNRAFADRSDAEGVAECVDDNKDARVSIEVITRYSGILTILCDAGFAVLCEIGAKGGANFFVKTRAFMPGLSAMG